MAIVLRENIGLLNDKLTVTLSKDDYLPAFEQSLKKYAKSLTKYIGGCACLAKAENQKLPSSPC